MTKLYLYVRRYLTLLLVFGALSAWAQQTVTGKVTSSEDGSGIPGANVVEKGTSNGTVTDADGNYKITVGNGATLVFSFIGYASQEFEVSGKTTIDVSLKGDVTALSEVVVIGYGQIQSKDATGALASLKSENFNAGVIASPEQLMQGRVAGVQITSTTGEPGAQTNIRIRGTSSVVSGNNPLYVVDGVPLSNDDVSAGNMSSSNSLGNSSPRNPLNFLNPNDIERIDVLKDASATAIYGSRGANGVVLITTKKGKSGKPTLEYSFNESVSNISKRYDLLDRNGFLNAYAKFNGQAAANTYDKGGNVNWQDMVLRTAYSQQHNVSYGDGDKNGDYRVSGSYLNQAGIIKTSGLKRYTVRFNGTKRFLDDKLTIATQFTIATTHDDNAPVTTSSGYAGDLIANMLKFAPSNPVYNPDGTFYQPGTSDLNPMALLRLSKSYTNTIRALGNLSAEYEIVKGLKFKTLYGFDRSSSKRVGAFSSLLNVQNIAGVGKLYLNDIDVDNKLWENYLTYDKTFGSVVFTGLLGYSYQSFNYATQNFELSNFRTTDLNVMINNFASADQSGSTNGPDGTPKVGATASNSSNTTDELQSYYGRLNFNIKEKYLLTATLRADGSTRFGANYKYGYFPSFAFKWRLSDEGFIPKEVFNDLSLRAGFGVTGNQNIPHNLYQARNRYADWNTNNGGDGNTGGGLSPVSFANPNLKWESTAQTNLGIDFGLFESKVRGSLDFYYKNTTNLLTQVTSAQPAAQPFTWINLPANVINKGIELVLETNPVVTSNFKWTLSGNAAYNHNRIKNLGTFYNAGPITGQGLTGAFAERLADGQPLYAYYVRQFAGFDANGLNIYPSGDVQKFSGKSPLPKWNLGLNNTFNYKAFDLSIFFSGQLGQYVYSNTANGFFTAGSLASGRNTTKEVANSNESNINSPDVSTRFLYNASFLRLQNATIGYNWTPKVNGISKLRFYVTGSNLLVITSYPYQDPEVSVSKVLNNVPSAGIDYTSYPKARTFTFGVNATF